MRDSKKKRSIHEEAMANFDRIQAAYKEEREQCLEDRRFYSIAGAQWEGSLNEQFENKPKFEVNKVHLAVMKIINEYRNNRITVNFISKDGKENNDLADVCDGLFRADERDSGATEAYDNAFEEAVGGGFGALRVTNKYEDEEDDENEQQRIRIEPIYDADSSVFFDLDAKRQDKADAKYCFVMFSMTPEEFEEEYGKSPTPVNRTISYEEYDWFSPDLVYVAEYYRVEEAKEVVHIYQNITGDEERYTDEELEDDPELSRRLEAVGTREVRQKKVSRKKVRKYILSGNEILEDCGYIAGKNIPIIPTYGKRWFVDSVERCMGHVRLVKDAQRLKNMLTSKLAEISALSTVEKPIFAAEQITPEYANMWSEDNIKNYPYLLAEPLLNADGTIAALGPTSYTKPPQIPQALAALMQIVDIDMKELLGGAGETEKMLSHVSGKAHEMLQKRIDGQAFIYMSNFAKAIQRVGEVWLSMAKEVYVEKGRNMKIIDSMDQVSSVELMQPGVGEYGVEDKNDITKATFDVAVDVGPSSASQRESTVSTVMGMLGLVQDPETAQVLQSFAMMNMEGDGIVDIRDFFRKRLVQMGAVKPTEEEAQQMAEAAKNAKPNPQEQALLAMAENEQAKAKKTQAEVVSVLTGAELDKAKALETYSNIDINRGKAGQEYLAQLQALSQQIQQAIAAQQQRAMAQQMPQAQPSAS